MPKFLFSGIKSRRELNLLKEAFPDASQRPGILIDRFDFHRVFIRYQQIWEGEIVLDSGAYRAFKKHLDLSTHESLNAYVRLTNNDLFAWRSSVDVFDDPAKTLSNFDYLTGYGYFVPVWHWGSDRLLLEYFLERSMAHGDGLVGIGGLVPHFRDEDTKARDRLITEVKTLCMEFPGRFHIFGACRMPVINRLAPFVQSFDSSLWLSGNKRRELIFTHSGTQKLHQAPVEVLDEYYDCADWSGDRISVENARNIHQYCQSIAPLEVCGSLAAPARSPL